MCTGREGREATAPLLAKARIVNSLKCNSWTINLANLGRHAQLTRCFSAVAELLARSSATAEKQRVSCACLSRLAN